jgi:hypothetical protein
MPAVVIRGLALIVVSKEVTASNKVVNKNMEAIIIKIAMAVLANQLLIVERINKALLGVTTNKVLVMDQRRNHNDV